MKANVLYYGDNLRILREYVADESVDLVYLDPPFKSNQDYNVLFKEQTGTRVAAQIMAFEDTWNWNSEAEKAFEDIVTRGGQTGRVIEAYAAFLRKTDMLAYLVMMAPRLLEMRRVLKPTGSIYLHCDPTASHYLKMLMDAVFGAPHFRNEIIWQRTNAHNIKAKYHMRVHDVILFYTKGDSYTWNQPYSDYSEAQLGRYREDQDGRLYTSQDLTMMSKTKARNFEWRGTHPPENRAWAVSREQLEKWWNEGLILTRSDGVPRLDGLKVYLDNMPGKCTLDIWTDIKRIGNTSKERLGYATQKPKALLERIIEANSREGDVVLDPFCGCGTTIEVAQALKRKWIGIDITHLAIKLIKKRLKDAFGGKAKYEIVGEPVDLSGARELAAQDKFEFQWWALSLVDAAPERDARKKGADQGIDGVRTFIDGKNRQPQHIIFSVKGGAVSVKDVRDLGHVVQRENAAIGVLVTLEKPTSPMLKEAVTSGLYHSDFKDTRHPKLQVITIEELLDSKELDLPVTAQMFDATYMRAPKVRGKLPKTGDLNLQ